MNPALNWTKKNWPVIVSGVVILGSLPPAWYFSTAWNAKIKKTQQDAASRELATTNVKVSYLVPNPIPGQPDLTMSEAPNALITDEFVKIKNELSRQTRAVIDRVTAFNMGTGPDAEAMGRTAHVVLVPDLFPGPSLAKIKATAFPGKDDAAIEGMAADVREPALVKALRDLTEPALRQMEDRLLGRRDNPDPYAALVKAANGGAPPLASDVLLTVQDKVTREGARLRQAGRELTAAEQLDLDKSAQATRLGRYQRAAKEFSVYMTRAALGAADSATPGGSVSVTGMRTIPSEAHFRAKPALGNDKDLFLFQWDQWVMSDMIAAIRLVNTVQGKQTGVEDSVVKRVDRLGAMPFDALEVETAAASNDGGFGAPEGSGGPAAAGVALKPDYKVSITGRSTSPGNPDYDVRNAVIVAVVSSERLPVFLDALSRVNFHAVLRVQLSHVDVKEDLDRGYYYGNEHVVRATITMESVWVRNWTGPLMPSSVKAVLGVPEPAAEVK